MLTGDVLFAYLDSPDSVKSIAEIAYFSALDKPVLVAIRPGSGADYDKMLDAYWFVLSLPNVRIRIVQHIEAAIAFLDELMRHLVLAAARWVEYESEFADPPEDFNAGIDDSSVPF